MSGELCACAFEGDLERVKQLVEGGVEINEIVLDSHDGTRETALLNACSGGQVDIVAYLCEHGADIHHADSGGMNALRWASFEGDVLTVKYLLKHGARISGRCHDGLTALLLAAENGSFDILKYLLSPEGGASITDRDNFGRTALLLAAVDPECHPLVVTWLLEFGGAKITDTDKAGNSVWTGVYQRSLKKMLKAAYRDRLADELFVGWTAGIPEVTAMLRVIVLRSDPSELFAEVLAPQLQQIVQDGARLRARLPAYLTQRRALIDVHCPLPSPLRDLVHGYEEPTTTDELWATGLGEPLQRPKRPEPERGKSQERCSPRLHKKRRQQDPLRLSWLRAPLLRTFST
jgi:hypothetical protein